MDNRYAMLPPADRELLDRLVRHPDPAEAARRRLLVHGPLGECDANSARDAVLVALLAPALRSDHPMRCDRIVRALAWPEQDGEPPITAPSSDPAPPAPLRAVPQPARIAQAPAEQVTAPQAAPTRAEAPQRTPCTAAAVEFLARALADGEQLAREIARKAAAAGLTAQMLRGARAKLGVLVERRGFGRSHATYWRMPNRPTPVHSGQLESMERKP